MKTLAFLLSLACAASAPIMHAQESIAQRLGYPADATLLIIHADDLGLAHTKNAASFDALLNGSVSSASIMMPTPWVTEVARFVKTHPDADLGLHLTLTSEWETYKWGPVAPIDEVSSLVDAHGYFYSSLQELAAHAKPEEVEKELRAQIELAYAFGFDPTHVDTHMMAVGARPEFQQIYLKLAAEYKLPALTVPGMAQFLFGYDDTKLPIQPSVSLDALHSANPEDYPNGMADRYRTILKSLKPGLNEIIIHAAHNDDEMKAISVDHPLWGAQWREADYEFFTSEECRELLEQGNIQLVTWREIRDKIIRAK